MDIKILAEGSTKLDKFFYNFGLSFLIDNKVLFDTFGRGDILLKNIKRMKIDVSKIEKIVISHLHWDHINGLLKICELNQKVEVFLPQNLDNDLKAKLEDLHIKLNFDRDADIEILPNIYKTKSLEFAYDSVNMREQFLVIKNNGKISILTGCSHPGIIKFLEHVKSNFIEPIDLIIGGFHLGNADDVEIKNVLADMKNFEFERIAPIHCTGKKAKNMIKNVFDDKFWKLERNIG